MLTLSAMFYHSTRSLLLCLNPCNSFCSLFMLFLSLDFLKKKGVICLAPSSAPCDSTHLPSAWRILESGSCSLVTTFFQGHHREVEQCLGRLWLPGQTSDNLITFVCVRPFFFHVKSLVLITNQRQLFGAGSEKTTWGYNTWKTDRCG